MTIEVFIRAFAILLSWRSKEDNLDQVLPVFFLSLQRGRERRGRREEVF